MEFEYFVLHICVKCASRIPFEFKSIQQLLDNAIIFHLYACS